MMRPPLLGALLLSLLVSPPSQAQPPTDNPPDAGCPAEVRFGDGSVVRMTVLQEDVVVQTRYGTLTIPVREIRKVEFGLHVPGDVDRQISASIKRLGSEVYRDRAGATRDLLQAGHWALPSLQKAARSPDKETAQRAGQVMKQLQDRVPPELLKLREDDVIHTAQFTVVGRIASPALKAHSAHFGEMALKLCDLRTLHVRQQAGCNELSVDATKFGSDAGQWLDTGLVVDPSLRLVLTCEGSVDLWPQGPGQYVATPKGYNTTGKGGVYMAGSLLGRVGETGKVFVVGERFEGTPAEEGKLFLHIVPSPWNNPSAGSYRVRIQADPVALTAR